MRRLLDPRQLEALSREEDGPRPTPIEQIQKALRGFLVLFALARAILLALAVSLTDHKGVVP